MLLSRLFKWSNCGKPLKPGTIINNVYTNTLRPDDPFHPRSWWYIRWHTHIYIHLASISFALSVRLIDINRERRTMMGQVCRKCPHQKCTNINRQIFAVSMPFLSNSLSLLHIFNLSIDSLPFASLFNDCECLANTTNPISNVFLLFHKFSFTNKTGNNNSSTIKSKPIEMNRMTRTTKT